MEPEPEPEPEPVVRKRASDGRYAQGSPKIPKIVKDKEIRDEIERLLKLEMSHNDIKNSMYIILELIDKNQSNIEILNTSFDLIDTEIHNLNDLYVSKPSLFRQLDGQNGLNTKINDLDTKFTDLYADLRDTLQMILQTPPPPVGARLKKKSKKRKRRRNKSKKKKKQTKKKSKK